jgi:hypothetical protein
MRARRGTHLRSAPPDCLARHIPSYVLTVSNCSAAILAVYLTLKPPFKRAARSRADRNPLFIDIKKARVPTRGKIAHNFLDRGDGQWR